MIFRTTFTHPCRIPFRPLFVPVMLFLLTGTLCAFTPADSLVVSQVFSDTTKKDATLSSDIDLKSQPGRIILALGSTKNLGAFSRFTPVYLGSLPPSVDPNVPDTGKINGRNLGDNNFFSFVEFPVGPSANTGSFIKVDLRSVRRLSSVVLVNLFNNPTTYRTRPRAFSLFSGLDSNSLSRVYQEVDNVDTANARYTMTIADVTPVQYLRISIDRLDATQSTVISEVQIFGEGFVPNGSFVAKVDSFTSPANIASIYADADFANGTSIGLQMRSGTTKTVDSLHWSDWSGEVVFSSTAEAAAGKPIVVREPRRYYQYRVNLYTANVGTPTVRGISFTYQRNLVADSLTASVSPDTIPAFTRTRIAYRIRSVAGAGSLGVDTVVIYTPAPVELNGVTVNGATVPFAAVVRPDRIMIGFASTVTGTADINVNFTTRLISNASFPSVLISKASPWNPQYAEPEGAVYGDGWRISTEGLSPKTIIDLKVDPNPFTPNGDGRNDATVIDFAIGNLVKPKMLRVFIYDLSGRRIRTITERQSGINPFYGDPRKGGSGILWDGKDEAGTVVRPGVYIVQAGIDTDGGGEFVTRTVVVAY